MVASASGLVVCAQPSKKDRPRMSVATVDERIAGLEHRRATETLTLKEEKEVMAQMYEDTNAEQWSTVKRRKDMQQQEEPAIAQMKPNTTKNASVYPLREGPPGALMLKWADKALMHLDNAWKVSPLQSRDVAGPDKTALQKKIERTGFGKRNG